jgi:hypothetical protein
MSSSRDTHHGPSVMFLACLPVNHLAIGVLFASWGGLMGSATQRRLVISVKDECTINCTNHWVF